MDPDKITVWLSILLSALLIVDRWYQFRRSLKKGVVEEKQDDLDLVKGYRAENQALQAELASVRRDHNELKAYVEQNGYEISFVFMPYPPSISSLKVKRITRSTN